MTPEITPSSLALPLAEFVAVARDWLGDWEDAAFPDDGIFQYVRALKAHPDLRSLTASDAYAALAKVAAFDVPGLGLLDEDGEVAFHSAWERVRFPLDCDPIQAACALAEDFLLQPRAPRPGRYRKFLTVAALLQIQVGRKPILLPVHRLAECFPCQANTVSSWTRWAREDGDLLKVREHAFRSDGGGRAAEYVFAIHRWQRALPTLAGKLGMPVRNEDVAWVQAQFEPGSQAAA